MERNKSGKRKAISVTFSLLIIDSSNALLSRVLFFPQLRLPSLLQKDRPESCKRGIKWLKVAIPGQTEIGGDTGTKLGLGRPAISTFCIIPV